jgi:tetratricopeptide (TPR) repeat protein
MRPALLLVTLLAACGHNGRLEEPPAAQAGNGEALFRYGVEALNTPDKHGVIDYAAAYDAFAGAAAVLTEPQQQAKAHFDAGWVAEVLGRPADAEAHYRSAAEADPGMEKARFSLARVQAAQGEHDDAVALYRAHLEAKPSDRHARTDLVGALAAAGRHEEAIAEARAVLLDDPQNADVYRHLAGVYRALGNEGMARLCAEKALALRAGDAAAWNDVGVALLGEDEAEAARKFETALQLDPEHFEANLNLGFLALDSGDFALALACFEKAAAARPSSVDAKLGLAVALRGTGQLDDAKAVYDDLLRADPANEVAAFNKAALERYRAAKAPPPPKPAADKSVLRDLEELVDHLEPQLAACPDDVQAEVLAVVGMSRQILADKDVDLALDAKSMLSDYRLLVEGCAAAE